MLPHPDSLSIPFKEGIRDIRCSIRLEAKSGALSNRLLGTPRPTRRLAKLADGFLSRAEKVVDRILVQQDVGLEAQLDRLMDGLLAGRLAERSADVYAVCQALLDDESGSGLLVSQLKLAIQHSDTKRSVDDPVLAAVRQAQRMAKGGFLRPCFSNSILFDDAEAGDERDARVALMCWLAVLVRAASREEGRAIVDSVRLVAEAEGETWLRLLRDGRMDELADVWRHTVPYLP